MPRMKAKSTRRKTTKRRGLPGGTTKAQLRRIMSRAQQYREKGQAHPLKSAWADFRAGKLK